MASQHIKKAFKKKRLKKVSTRVVQIITTVIVTVFGVRSCDSACNQVM